MVRVARMVMMWIVCAQALQAAVLSRLDDGTLEKRDPPPMRFYRGLVGGDRDSFAFFAVDPAGGHIHGFVVVHDQRFEIHDHDLVAYSAADDIGHTWSCGVEHLNVTPSALRRARRRRARLRRAEPPGVRSGAARPYNVPIPAGFAGIPGVTYIPKDRAS